MELLRYNKTAVRLAKKLVWMKKNQPVKYKIISSLTDGMVFCFWLLTSLGSAILLSYHGFCTLDSALFAVAILDVNVCMFDMFLHPGKWDTDL